MGYATVIFNKTIRKKVNLNHKYEELDFILKIIKGLLLVFMNSYDAEW